MQLTSLLLVTLASTISLVDAALYDTCLAEFRSLHASTGLLPHEIHRQFINTGSCQGCTSYAMSIAFSFDLGGRTVVSKAAFKELMTLC